MASAPVSARKTTNSALHARTSFPRGWMTKQLAPYKPSPELTVLIIRSVQSTGVQIRFINKVGPPAYWRCRRSYCQHCAQARRHSHFPPRCTRDQAMHRRGQTVYRWKSRHLPFACQLIGRRAASRLCIVISLESHCRYECCRGSMAI
jgi:hypothetical protein